jgi:hypothetical protein
MSLSLKESFRTMNFLDATITSLSYYVRDTNNAIKVTEKHYKSKSNSETTDEEIDVTTERTYPNASVVDVVYLINQLIKEKTKLALAIEYAKKFMSLGYDEDDESLTLDSAVEAAKKSRDLAIILKNLVDLKSSETKKKGVGYKFNVEGNETTYKYDIDVVKTIDFNRVTLNNTYKKLLDRADKLSTLIESAMLQEKVSYEPLYSIHDSVTDIVEKYIASKVGKEE